MHQKTAGSISGQGTYLACGFDPQGAYRKPPIDVSHIVVSVSLPLPLALKISKLILG